MDLKLLMAEKGINTKEFDLNDDLEVEIKQLKKRQENTALNIYQIRVEDDFLTKAVPKYKHSK